MTSGLKLAVRFELAHRFPCMCFHVRSVSMTWVSASMVAIIFYSNSLLLPRPLGEDRGEGASPEKTLILAFSQREKEPLPDKNTTANLRLTTPH